MGKALFLIAVSIVLACPSSYSEKSEFDLTSFDLNNEIVFLKGQWQMEYGALLNAEEMKRLQDPSFYEVPHAWGTVTVDGESISSTGYATYFTQIVVKPGTTGLALLGEVMSTNYDIYANGKLIGQVGKVGTTKETAQPNYQTKVFPLPAADTIEIIVHVSNFHYRKGGMTMVPQIGNQLKLLSDKANRISLSFFLIGSIFFMGLFHLASNLFRTRNKMNTYFILVCSFTIIRTLTVNEYLLIEYFDMPWWLSTRIELISFYLLLAFTTRFIYYLFPDYISSFFTKIPFYIGIVASIVTAFIPLYYSSYLVPVLQVSTLLTCVGILYYMVKALRKKDNEVWIAFIGFALLFVATIIEILIHHSQLLGDSVFALGIFSYLFSHVVILSIRQNETYVENLKLSLALQRSNQSLERTVAERTKELHIRNDKLVENNKELKSLHEDKDGLIHVIAHDLKAPLNHNIGIGRLLKKSKNLDSEQKLYIEKLEYSNQNGLKLIESLLQLHEIETQQKAAVQPINIKSVFEEIMRAHQTNAEFKNIQVEQSIESLNTPFHTDPDKLRRVMDNLISNALKFSYDKGKVMVSVLQESNGITIDVKDHGMGIRKEEQNKLFKKFQKMSNKPTGGESSSGLGLSIVKMLVEQLKGSITFKSEYGDGTQFTISLPDLS